jgi:hypothetical protein
VTVESPGPFLKYLILVPLTLLPIINPLSAVPAFTATAGTNRMVVCKFARQVAVNSWFVLVGSMLVGVYVLDIFGISLQVVRIGGGLLVAASGWHMLASKGGDEVHQAIAHQSVDLTDREGDGHDRRGDLPELPARRPGDGQAGRRGGDGHHAPVRLHPAVHRHRDHVDRLGGPEPHNQLIVKDCP